MDNEISKLMQNCSVKVKIPPLLSTDVLRYSLQLADRNTLEKCQLVCREWDDLIQLHPESFKQRRRFDKLDIAMGNPNPIGNMKNWTDIAIFNQCCCCNDTELEAMANSMAGTRVLNIFPRHELMHVLLSSTTANKSIYLQFPNQFTPTTAFNFLHMLKHLNGCFIKWVHLSSILLPPTFTATTIHCDALLIYIPPLLSQLQQLTTVVFKPQEVSFAVDVQHIEVAIQAITTIYGPMPFPGVLIVLSLEREEFEEALNFFHTQDVRSTISEVKFELIGDGDWSRWPLQPFNPQEATNSQEEQQQANGIFVFNRTNQQSGEKYKVMIKLREEEEDRVDDVSISFHT